MSESARSGNETNGERPHRRRRVRRRTDRTTQRASASRPPFNGPTSSTTPTSSDDPATPANTVVSEGAEHQPTSTAPVLRAPSEGIPPLITDPAELTAATEALRASTMPSALDTERAQGRRYGSGAYLVQIRKDDVGTFLIDSHALPDLSSMQAALDTTWIFHAADQDLRCLLDLGLQPPDLFDTEIAARLTGMRRFSLGALTEELLDVRLMKTHQDEDWSRRPLPRAWLSYAALDVELLTALKAELESRLDQLGRSDWAAQEFEFEIAHPVEPRPPSWRNLKGVGRLRRPEELAVAKELWETREEIGRSTDLAPGRVLATRGLIEAAALQPRSKRALSSIDAFRRPVAKRNMDAWWEAVEKAYALPQDQLPQKVQHDPSVIPAASAWRSANPEGLARLEEVRALVAKIAEGLDVDPEVVLAPRDQRVLAWKPLTRRHSLTTAFTSRLEESEAREWQKELVIAELARAAKDSHLSVAALTARAQ